MGNRKLIVMSGNGTVYAGKCRLHHVNQSPHGGELIFALTCNEGGANPFFVNDNTASAGPPYPTNDFGGAVVTDLAVASWTGTANPVVSFTIEPLE